MTCRLRYVARSNVGLRPGQCARLLYGVRSADLLTYGAVTTLLAAVTLLATLLPGRRAAHANPADALRPD